MPFASFSPGRWWQHCRAPDHVGDRSCPVCSCRVPEWRRRLRRSRRVELTIGESGLRLAGTVTRRHRVSVAQQCACWSAAGVATCPRHREATAVRDASSGSARPGCGRRRDPSGSSRCIARSALHLARDQERYALRSEGTRASCLAGSAGIISAAATSRSSPDQDLHCCAFRAANRK